MPDERRKVVWRGRSVTYYGMVPDDDPIYRNAGWNFLTGPNLNQRLSTADNSAVGSKSEDSDD
jgi:hypothetical protein